MQHRNQGPAPRRNDPYLDNAIGQQKYYAPPPQEIPTRTLPYQARGMVAPYSRITATQHLDEERKAVIKHLERLIERERGHGLQIQEQFQDQIQQIKLKLASNAQKLDSESQQLEVLEEEKQLLQQEHVRVEEQIKDSLNKKSTIQRQLNERLDEAQKQRAEVERKFTIELNDAQTDHFNHLRDLDSEWGKRCEDLMDQNRQIDEYNQETLKRINDIKDQIHTFNQDSHGKTTDLIEKIKKLVLSEFKEKLNLMETQINKLDEERLKISRNNKDTLTDAQKNLRKQVEEFEYMMKDKTRLIIENQSVSHKKQQYDLFNQSLQLEVKHKQQLQTLLGEELDLLKEKNQKVNQEDSDQLNKIIHLHSLDQKKHTVEIEQLRQRAEAITKTIQDNELQNSRLFGDIGRITELLQANASKVIYQTFAENKFI